MDEKTHTNKQNQLENDIKILWLRPSTGENVSTRRQRISEHLEDCSISITFCNMSLLNSYSGIYHILSMNYDLIIANVRLPLYISFPLAKLFHKPIIADVSDPISQIADLPEPIYTSVNWYEWLILRHADAAVFAESKSYKQALEMNINSTLAKNSVNFNDFANPPHKITGHALTELKTHGVNMDAPIAIYPGRFAPVYHIEEMLNAAKITNEWEFVFLGEDMEQAAVEKASKQEQNVHYLGSYDHKYIPGFLYHADVGLCLVDVERPLKILEYGAAMLPTLGIPGDLETEFSEEQMWFTNPTPEDIICGLNQIRNNPTEALNRSKHLRQTARKNSWENIAAKYLDIIHKMLDE